MIEELNNNLMEIIGDKKIDINFDKKEKYLVGRGKNAKVYKIELDKKLFSLKAYDLFTDTPLIKDYTDNKIISQTAINDIIISHYLTKLNIIYVHKFIGYQITNNYIYMIREWIEKTYSEYINENGDSEIISISIIHILIALLACFQGRYKGQYNDAKIENILMKKTDKKNIRMKLNNKTYKIPIIGYLPCLTDFGGSIIFKIDNKKVLIKRHTMWKKHHTKKDKYDKSYDLFLLFYNSFKKNPIISNNWIYKEYINILNNEYKIRSFNDYYKNSLTIRKFLSSPKIEKYLEKFKIL